MPSIPGKGPIFFMPEDILPVIDDEESVFERAVDRQTTQSKLQETFNYNTKDNVIYQDD